MERTGRRRRKCAGMEEEGKGLRGKKSKGKEENEEVD